MRTLGLALFILGFGAAGCGASAPEQTTNQQQHLGACGGLGGIQCPSGQTCVDDPNDSCDPQNGGADCGGICVKATPVPPQMCGGFGGLVCPSGQTCIDDPNDSCDPQNGGADCGGICVTP